MAEIIVSPGTDTLARASASSPTGTSFLCSGTYLVSQLWKPKQGQSFVAATADSHPVLEPTGDYTVATQATRTKGFECDEVAGVTVMGFEVSGFFYGIRPGPSGHVANCHVHDCPSTGIAGGFKSLASGCLVEDNEVDHCGSTDQLGTGSAGMKFARTGKEGVAGSGVITRHNNVHDNVGVGIWRDIDSAGDIDEGNTVTNNTRKGLFYEISFGPWECIANTVHGNGRDQKGAGGGIVLVSSRVGAIHDNILGDNDYRNGIRIRKDNRPYQFVDVQIGPNTLGGDRMIGCAQRGVHCS